LPCRRRGRRAQGAREITGGGGFWGGEGVRGVRSLKGDIEKSEVGGIKGGNRRTSPRKGVQRNGPWEHSRRKFLVARKHFLQTLKEEGGWVGGKRGERTRRSTETHADVKVEAIFKLPGRSGGEGGE